MSLKQISDADWKEVADSIPVCTLPYTPEELAQRYGVNFREYEGESLGLCRYAVVEVLGRKFYLSAHIQDLETCHLLSAYVLSYDLNPSESCRLLASALGFKQSDLPWTSDHLGKAKWSLVRLDDNGNEAEMYRFMRKTDAEWARDRYEAKGHKQSYLVKELM